MIILKTISIFISLIFFALSHYYEMQDKDGIAFLCQIITLINLMIWIGIRLIFNV